MAAACGESQTGGDIADANPEDMANVKVVPPNSLPLESMHGNFENMAGEAGIQSTDLSKRDNDKVSGE